MDINKLNELKIHKKKIRPKFIRRKAGVIKKVSKVWRKPQGGQDKVRLCKRGKIRSVSIGYSTPTILKGLTKDLKELVTVVDVKGIEKLTKDQCAILPGSMGGKKKLMLLKVLKEKSKNVYGFGTIDEMISSIENKFTERIALRKGKKSRMKTQIVKETKKDSKIEAEKSKKDSSSKKSDVKSEDLKDSKEKDRKEVEQILIHNQ